MKAKQEIGNMQHGRRGDSREQTAAGRAREDSRDLAAGRRQQKASTRKQTGDTMQQEADRSEQTAESR
jgi:hypothetical protein